MFNPGVRKIPWRRKWQPTPVFLPGKSHEQRRWAGYSLWSHKRVGHNWATKHIIEKKKNQYLPSRSNVLLLFIFKTFTNNFQENKRIVKNNFIQNFHKEYKHIKQFLLYIFPLSRYIKERNLNVATFSEFS